jgi:sulfoxide reductase heme-binding subunit YedZ
MLALWLKKHFLVVWRAMFVAAAMPLLWLVWNYFNHSLGTNPLETLTSTTGRSALVLLAVTLSVTPLRKGMTNLSRAVHLTFGKRIADWNWLVRLRRMLGLWCFVYAALHALVFLELDLAWDWPVMASELMDKKYLMLGALAFVLLIPLAITSPKSMMRRLGRNWLRLHRLVYVVAILATLHFCLLVKPGSWRALPDTLVMLALLGYRLVLWQGWARRWEGSNGLEVPERITDRLPDADVLQKSTTQGTAL